MVVWCTIPEREAEPTSTKTKMTAAALKSGATIRMESLHFDADSSRIKPEFESSLIELYNLLIDNPELIVEIGGHTNGMPDHKYCDRLSGERARAVADWIIDKGIDSKRVTSKGYGKRKPIATNRSLEGRRKNQRVEVRMVEGGSE
jgi:outer membrane protein OmpA-like peptidoglycan-associated protein